MTTDATLTKFAGESDLFYLDCSKQLAADDTITGAISMAYLPAGLLGADALTFGTALVNTAPVNFPDGRIGRVGAVIIVRISGGTPAAAAAERGYTVMATFGTAVGNTKTARGRLLLLPLAL